MIATTHAQTAFILPLDSESATLHLAGGKGANLSRLARAGFPVPGGFLLTTLAYQEFVSANGLESRILAALPSSEDGSIETIEAASSAIRALFVNGNLPGGLVEEIARAYAGLGRPPVAVRSSATAEDLPETSFAGQQDTYLNVVGEEALLEAVKNCWGSLWTARAITYRLRNAVHQAGMALSVVVQTMVESQVSGVLFTANPLTGLRGETVIDAIFGLGEALVSGQVDPDHYVVDARQNKIITRTLGAKAISIRGQAGGGTVTAPETLSQTQALPDAAILDLAKMGQQVAARYAFPQDIEWAWAGNKLLLLQSRPITSLYPTPDGIPAEPLKVWVSFGAIQGLFDPITPFGRDVLRQVAAIASGLFGIKVTAETQGVFFTAGERLWPTLPPL